jgi:hypothetical protein
MARPLTHFKATSDALQTNHAQKPCSLLTLHKKAAYYGLLFNKLMKVNFYDALIAPAGTPAPLLPPPLAPA